MTPPTVSYSNIHIAFTNLGKSIFARVATLFFALGLCAATAASAQNLELLMVEDEGCVYCAQWHAEIGPEFPITPEGQTAPLRQTDIDDPLPDGVTLARRAVYTPTFVLLKNGAETGRIEGYPGEEFFWFLLGQLIDAAG